MFNLFSLLKYSYEDLLEHKFLKNNDYKDLIIYKYVEDLYEIIKDDNERQILEEEGILDLIGQTLDNINELLTNSKLSNIEVLINYESCKESILSLFYICNMKFGVTFSLNKKINKKYIILSFYDNHLFVPKSENRRLINLGRLDKFRHEKNTEINIYARQKFIHITSDLYLKKYFPSISKSKRENPFQPKHKPRPKGFHNF